jgi:hypothetical protein
MNRGPMFEGKPMPPEMFRMCKLVRDGRAACGRGEFAEAEHLFNKLKETAPDDAARNCARLHLATVYGFRHIPGLTPECRVENAKFIDRAEAEYIEVLANHPTRDQYNLAMTGLAALKTFRRLG